MLTECMVHGQLLVILLIIGCSNMYQLLYSHFPIELRRQ